jgi:hypothetical protein
VDAPHVDVTILLACREEAIMEEADVLTPNKLEVTIVEERITFPKIEEATNDEI